MHSLVIKRLGIFSPYLYIFLFGLSFLTISRFFLSMWNFDRVTNVNGWSEIFISGLRVDIATLSYLFVIPALITCLMINYKNLKKIWLFFLRIWIVLSIWLLVFMEVVTPSFILEYDVRPNRLFVEYLMYPSELMNMLLSGYKTELTIVTLLSSLTLYYSLEGLSSSFK